MNFTFGSDPEFMLMNGNQYVSAIPIVKASGKDPIMENGNGFYWDNVLAEAAVKPASSREEAIANFREMIHHYAKIVSPAKLVLQSSQDYPESALKEKEAKIAGCEPDACVYTMRLMSGELSPARKIETTPFRTSGGHVHLGAEMLTTGGIEGLFCIYLMDVFLGAPSVLMDKDPTSPARRNTYGEAGRHRFKPYGLEYRTLGNFWLASPEAVGLVYDVCNFILDLLPEQKIITWDEQKFMSLCDEGLPPGDALFFTELKKDEVKDCIDNSDAAVATKVAEYGFQFMPTELVNRIKNFNYPQSQFYKAWGI